VAIVQRVLRFIGDRQAARWDRFGGPGPALRWSFRHPWLVTLTTAGLLAVALGAVFGVPPFSPLVLVIVLVSPVAPVLRMLSRIHDRWLERDGHAPTGSDAPPDTVDGDTGAPRDTEPDGDPDASSGSERSPSTPPDERT